MGKPKRERVACRQRGVGGGHACCGRARASSTWWRGLIRGLDAGRARDRAEFSRKRIAHEVRKTLESAIANAENNHNLDVDRLFVAEASVGKQLVMKRMHARARGRVGQDREACQPAADRRARAGRRGRDREEAA